MLLAVVALCSIATVASAALVPGCYVDVRERRQLPRQVCLATGGCATLSREWCGWQCQALGFALAGVEASHQCACADALTTPDQAAPASECNETCTGAANETCGGNLRVWVFEAGSVGPAPPTPAPTPRPHDARLQPIWHTPGAGAVGYAGDPNGLMYRHDSGLYHFFWQHWPDWPPEG